MPEPTPSVLLANTLSDAWVAAAGGMLDTMNRVVGGSFAVHPIVLSSFNGKLSIQYDYFNPDFPDVLYRNAFVAQAQDSGEIVPLRYFCQGEGIFQTITYAAPGSTTLDAFITLFINWYIPGKMTVLHGGTDAAPPEAVYKNTGPTGNVYRIISPIIVASSTQDVCIIQDVFTSYTWNALEINTPGLGPSPTPTQARGTSRIVDMSQTNRLLQDIALRDFHVQFNHGAQQFSATGAVKIP